MGEKKEKQARLLREWADGAVERSEALFQASLALEKPRADGIVGSEGTYDNLTLSRARIRADRAAVLAAGDVVAEAVDELAEDVLAMVPPGVSEDDDGPACCELNAGDSDLHNAGCPAADDDIIPGDEDLPSAGPVPFSLVNPKPPT